MNKNFIFKNKKIRRRRLGPEKNVGPTTKKSVINANENHNVRKRIWNERKLESKCGKEILNLYLSLFCYLLRMHFFRLTFFPTDFFSG